MWVVFRGLPLLLSTFLLLEPLALAQLRDWQARGRMQYRARYNNQTGDEYLLRRARFWVNGFLASKISTRFQYGFVSKRVFDLWISYKPSSALEVRFGQSWLPFIGDFTTAPFFLDTIDFSAGSSLTPPREKGFFILGKHKQIEYSLSIVNGNGFESDENSHKDIFGFIRIPVLKEKIFLGAGHYEGRKGPSFDLVIKRRTTGDFEIPIGHLLTLKGAYIRGIDGSAITDAYWFRTLIHAHNRINLVFEYDALLQESTTSKWINVEINYYLPLRQSNFKVYFRRFTAPTQHCELKAQLQLVLGVPWSKRLFR